MTSRYYIIATLALLLATSCGNKQKESDNHSEAHEHGEHNEELVLTDAQMEAVDIQLGKIEKRELNSIVRANGTLRLDPQNKADVTSLTGGIVNRIYVREGQNVHKGQTVALIENTAIVEMQKNYLTTRKRLALAEQEYERQKNLNSNGAGVEKNLQQAKADCDISRAEELGLRQQLIQLSLNPQHVEQGQISPCVAVKAPIGGIVSRINISTGSYADTQTSLMSISDNSAVYCSLNVFENDISRIKIGQEAYFTVTGKNGTHFSGKVVEINRSIDGQSKTIPVHIKIDEAKDAQLIPDMYVTATVNTGTQKSDALPDAAIVSMEGRNFVFVLERKEKHDNTAEYKFEQREVIAGTSELGYTQVSFPRPLPENATIVTKNAFYLASIAGEHGEH